MNHTAHRPRPLLMRISRPLYSSLLVLAISLTMVGVAWAQASVDVVVRDSAGQPADGQVTLTPAGDGVAHQCQTSGGACEIAGVAGGRYTAQFQPTGGTNWPGQTVMIPPAGRVALRINQRPAR